MPDPVTAVMLAHSAVQLISPILSDAAKAGAGQVGKSLAKALGGAAATLYGKLQERLAQRGAATALERYEAAPADAGRRGALEYAVESALDSDPEWRVLIADLVEKAGSEARSGPMAMRINGDGSIGAQVTGVSNQVTIHHRARPDE